MLEPSNALRTMRAYSPPTGGRTNLLRLDFNENTVGCSPVVLDALTKALSGNLLATYPEYGDAKQALAKFFGLPQDQLMITNGTDEAIQVAMHTFVNPGDDVILLTPTYAMYRFYAELVGASVVEVRYGSGDWDFEFQVSKLLDAVTPRTRAIFIANPNNPTGTTVRQEEIEQILKTVPDTMVFVDEAYFEFFGQSAISLLEDYPNLVISRTFSKAYGLAGLRLGCLLSQGQNIALLSKAQSPYSVNALAAVAAIAAAGDADFVKTYVRKSLEGRAMIEQAFGRLGIRYWPSEANFILFQAGSWAEECLCSCRAAGVLIRDRRHDAEGALRVTAGPPEHAQQFIEVLHKISIAVGGKQ